MQTFSQHVNALHELDSWLDELNLQLEPKQTMLVQIFGNSGTEQALNANVCISKRWPHACVIGLSCEQSLHHNEITHAPLYVAISIFNNCKVVSGITPISDNLKHCGQQLLSQLTESQTKALLIYTDSLGNQSETFYRSLKLHKENIAIIGADAMACPQRPWLLLNNKIYRNSILGLALTSPSLRAWSETFVEWFPIGRQQSIGKADGERVYYIGNERAYDLYCHFLNDGRETTQDEILTFPLLRSSEKNYQIIRPVCLHDDGSISFSQPLIEGEQVRFVYHHPELMAQHLDACVDKFSQLSPQSQFIFSRSKAPHSRQTLKHDVTALSALAPTCGAFTFGETTEQQTQLYHHSLSCLGLSEAPLIKQPKPTGCNANKQNGVANLFRMIHHSIVDLEHMTQDLEDQVTKKNSQLLKSLRTNRLTGLPNHYALQELGENTEHIGMLMILKLTNLVNINEYYGYQVGDRVLRYLSTQIGLWCREQKDYLQLYNISHSEWLITFAANVDTRYMRQALINFIEITESTAIPLEDEFGYDELNVNLAAGICQQDSEAQHIGKLMLRAQETRRYTSERNLMVCDASELIQDDSPAMQRISALRLVNHALQNQQIKIYGQPQLYANTRAHYATECLVRIDNGKDILPPGAFLSAIQDTHVYSRMSRYIIEQSLNIMDASNARLSINLAPQDLHNETTINLLLDRVAKLKKPHLLGIEIIESEQIQNYTLLKNIADALRRHKVKVIIDDFGSGYSNIDEILSIEPDLIKFDGSLIRDIHSNARQRLIVSNMVNLFDSLNIETVAEFVHCEEVCKVVESLGVNYLQGFYLAKPSSLELPLVAQERAQRIFA